MEMDAMAKVLVVTHGDRRLAMNPCGNVLSSSSCPSSSSSRTTLRGQSIEQARREMDATAEAIRRSDTVHGVAEKGGVRPTRFSVSSSIERGRMEMDLTAWAITDHMGDDTCGEPMLRGNHHQSCQSRDVSTQGRGTSLLRRGDSAQQEMNAAAQEVMGEDFAASIGQRGAYASPRSVMLAMPLQPGLCARLVRPESPIGSPPDMDTVAQTVVALPHTFSSQ